jgi:hypothetical protein
MISYYFVIYLGHRNITLSFPYRPSLRFQAKLSALLKSRSLGLDCRVCSLAAERPASSFRFFSAPHTKHGPPGDLLGVLGHAARAAARLLQQLWRQGRSRAKRIGDDLRGAPRGGGSRFHGGGSFYGGGLRGGGLRGGSLRNLGGSVRASRQDFRATDRAGIRHAEPLVCELALAQGVSGFSLLSERHGEGAAAQGLELSSQTLRLLLVCRGCGFGGCHCRLGRRSLGAL